ncbi:hypothetical protein OESDEN_13274 [Oesophagostomum dentatum]|uniref:Uncharacterized protein n=1 Tax=Oesophagostomum dentatum TaxID=61180 RepID=A0A0B1SST8_OESDE|nr:hypothetical protein OESDEN_13274 [Oesophagostomum dentatum]
MDSKISGSGPQTWKNIGTRSDFKEYVSRLACVSKCYSTLFHIISGSNHWRLRYELRLQHSHRRVLGQGQCRKAVERHQGYARMMNVHSLL